MNAAQKSALLLLTLGEEHAAEVFKHLNTEEVTAISVAMETVKNVTHTDISQVLGDFYQDVEQYAALNIDVNDYLRTSLIKALGEDQALSLLNTIYHQGNNNGIETLEMMEPGDVADLIYDEHPQIIATILIHLKRHHAAEVLARFAEDKRNDIMLRIATFGGVQPEALQELTEVLNTMLHGQHLRRSKMGGIRPAAEILNLMNNQQEEAIIKVLREFDNDLAQKIVDEMFLFESLLEVDDQSIQRIIQEVDSGSLVIALKGAEAALVDKFLHNMSTRQAEILREDLQTRGPIRRSDVEAEQKKILLVIRQLVEKGEVVLGGGEDVYV